METKRKRGTVLGVVAVMVMVTLCTLPATESSAADPVDGRMEVEVYTDTALALSPGGWTTGAKASGSALQAGLEWSDGTLEGTIATPGTYAVTFKDGGRESRIHIDVLERPAVDGVGGVSFKDIVVHFGAREGTVLFDATVTGPRDMEVSYDLGPLFRYEDGNVVLARDLTASDAGIHEANVDVAHDLKHAGLSGTATLHANVLVVASSGSPEELAQQIPPSTHITTVVSSEGTFGVQRDLYASPVTDPTVHTVGIDGDGRDVTLSMEAYGCTDAVIEWGDGTRSVVPVGTDGLIASHSYDDDGTYAIAVQVSGPSGEGSAVAVYGTDAPASDDGVDLWVLILIYAIVMAVLIALTALGFVPSIVPIVIGIGGLALVLINGVFRC